MCETSTYNKRLRVHAKVASTTMPTNAPRESLPGADPMVFLLAESLADLSNARQTEVITR